MIRPHLPHLDARDRVALARVILAMVMIWTAVIGAAVALGLFVRVFTLVAGW